MATDSSISPTEYARQKEAANFVGIIQFGILITLIAETFGWISLVGVDLESFNPEKHTQLNMLASALTAILAACMGIFFFRVRPALLLSQRNAIRCRDYELANSYKLPIFVTLFLTFASMYFLVTEIFAGQRDEALKASHAVQQLKDEIKTRDAKRTELIVGKNIAKIQAERDNLATLKKDLERAIVNEKNAITTFWETCKWRSVACESMVDKRTLATKGNYRTGGAEVRARFANKMFESNLIQTRITSLSTKAALADYALLDAIDNIDSQIASLHTQLSDIFQTSGISGGENLNRFLYPQAFNDISDLTFGRISPAAAQRLSIIIVLWAFLISIYKLTQGKPLLEATPSTWTPQPKRSFWASAINWLRFQFTRNETRQGEQSRQNGGGQQSFVSPITASGGNVEQAPTQYYGTGVPIQKRSFWNRLFNRKKSSEGEGDYNETKAGFVTQPIRKGPKILNTAAKDLVLQEWQKHLDAGTTTKPGLRAQIARKCGVPYPTASRYIRQFENEK